MKIWIAGILSTCLIISAALSAGGVSQRDLSTVQGKISSVRQKLAQTKKKQKAVQSQLYHTQRQLRDTRSDLGSTRRHLTQARGDLDRINRDLREMENKLDDRRDELAVRLADAYKNPPTTYLTALLSTGDTWSAMTRATMVQYVVENDKAILADLRETREKMRKKEIAQRQRLREITSIQRTLSAQEQREKQLAWAQDSQLKTILRDRRAYESHLDGLLRESSRIASMIRASQSTPAGRQRASVAFKGGFIRPVSGSVTSPYGMRYHPILKKRKMHTGVDLRASSGTPIKAAASGTVIISGWMNGYGNTVVIDHGGNTSTLYAHCSSLNVRVGQKVSQGSTIAKVGSTGWSTGPHLHFEVRKNGQPVNPM